MAEMLAARVDAGPSGFMYRSPAEHVLSDMAVADTKADDPLRQLMSSRTTVFRLLWILCRQIREMGTTPVAPAGKGGA
jgi:hypothetical protein